MTAFNTIGVPIDTEMLNPVGCAKLVCTVVEQAIERSNDVFSLMDLASSRIFSAACDILEVDIGQAQARLKQRAMAVCPDHELADMSVSWDVTMADSGRGGK